jgi:Rne/Rng family ribonuclease
MAKEICISSTPHETRLAILEDDQLAEIYYERENEYTLAGSIYNGRVTRVLPGMQSAFVDLGLERDAFLYVTDFLEMEEPEDSDEIERAAVSSGNIPPREVHHREDRGEQEQRPARRDHDRDQDRRGRRPAAEPAALEAEPVQPQERAAGAPESQHEDSDEAGAKRWRGRRRRRGGRGGAPHVSDPVETEASAESFLEPGVELSLTAEETPSAEPEHRPAPAREPRAPRGEREPATIVLPGESLSKYGAEPAATSAPAKDKASGRPRTTSRPSTLIEAPLTWDGSGLLPGESLARHRNRDAEPSRQVDGEPQGVFADAQHLHEEEQTEEETMESEYVTPETSSGLHSEDLVEEELVREEPAQEPLPGAHAEIAAEAHDSDPFTSDPFFAEKNEGYAQEEHTGQPHGKPAGEDYSSHAPIPEPSTEVVADWITPQKGDPDQPNQDSGGTQPEEDRSASHRVDPLPPSEFRLFGIGGKKKKEEPTDSPAPASSASATAAPPRPSSSFAPGAGVVEEEVVEGEEYDAPRHAHHKSEEGDFDDYEVEEKVQKQIRSGDLGEMLQEAHLDHRIQLNFDDKTAGEEEDETDEEGEDEQPAAGAPATHPRRERGGRGRRSPRGAQTGGGNGRRPSRRSAQTSDLPIISDLLKPGQEILVQIAKEPIAKKGARITSHIALPGRFLVFMPTVSHVGVSRKIASDEERQRLKRILISERGETSGGFIVRTAAEGASEDELRADLRFLIHLWDEIKTRSEKSKAPALIYHDLSLIERILRDQVSADFSSIWVDSQDDYERIVRFLNRFAPTMVRRVKLYTKETPLFEHFGIQEEISKALRSKVWLKSGGSIVINQTEALVAIDINTGKYVGKTARLEDTIVKTNLDAIPEIVRQIRLRDLGGIIIIDFIDMDERKNRFKVMAALEEALKNDRAPTKVLQFNDFGLVAITRKRVKQSLERTLSIPCPTCQATGMVKSPATVANEIYTELRKMRKHFDNSDVLLRVNPETVKVLKANNARWLTEYEDLTGKNILVKSDPALHPEQFDIQG